MTTANNAFENGNVNQARSLIKEGRGVDGFDGDGFAHLFHATLTTRVDAWDVLIGSQADTNMNIEDWYRLTALLCLVL